MEFNNNGAEERVSEHVYLSRHVLAGPVGRVGIGVGLQDVVEVGALSRRLNIPVQDGRCSDAPRVEPLAKRRGQVRSGEVTYGQVGGAGSVHACLLAVGVFALY